MYSKKSIRQVILIGVSSVAVLAVLAMAISLLVSPEDEKDNPKLSNSSATAKDRETTPSIPQGQPTVPAAKPTVPTVPEDSYTVSVPPADVYETIGGKIDLSGATAQYQKDYMGLYANPQEIVPTDDKVVYLTFDDGPSANTAKVLDKLDKYGIKATFFVVSGNKNSETTAATFKDIVDRGHAIGIHTYTHQYKEIYQSVDSFLADMNKVNQDVYNATGIRPSVYRFPGGSLNNFNKDVVHDIIAEMERRGFRGYDWNSSTQDAEGKKFTAQQLADNAISTFSERKRVMILAHDGGGQKLTPDSIGPIVEYAKANGYRFATLDNSVAPIMFVKKK